MKVTKCLVSVYGNIDKEELRKKLISCEDIKVFAFGVNVYQTHLPNFHVFLDFGKTKYTVVKVEQLFKDFKIPRSFVECVIYRENDIIGFLNGIGHSSSDIIASFKF